MISIQGEVNFEEVELYIDSHGHNVAVLENEHLYTQWTLNAYKKLSLYTLI